MVLCGCGRNHDEEDLLFTKTDVVSGSRRLARKKDSGRHQGYLGSYDCVAFYNDTIGCVHYLED